MSTLRKISLIILALMVGASSLGMASYSDPVRYCSKHHTVAANESLKMIALTYGKSVKDLMFLNNIPVEQFVFAGQRLCVDVDGRHGRKPFIQIDNTVRDTSVSITLMGFVANDSVDILLGPSGSKGVNGYKVATVTVGNPPNTSVKVNIPVQLRGATRLDVRAQTNSKRVASYWFYNMTSAPTYSELASSSVSGYVYNKTVSINLANAPAAITYKVILVAMNGRKYKSVNAGTLATGVGGALTATFNLPAALSGKRIIYVLLQDPASGSFAYTSYTNK